MPFVPLGVSVDVPGDAFSLWVFLLVILPGLVWSGVRVSVRGRGLRDKELSTTVVQALVTSVLFDSVYLLVLGDSLVTRVSRVAGGDLSGTRGLSMSLLFLAILIPALSSLAWNGDVGWCKRTLLGVPVPIPVNRSPYQPTPTAWDKALPTMGGRWIRIRRSDGAFVGGWFANGSYLSSYPEARDLYVESQHHMNEDGSFGDEVDGTAGFWIAVQDDDIVEFINPPGEATA